MFTKHTQSESVEVLSPKQHKVIQEELRKTGHTAVNELNPQQKEQVTQKVAKA